MTWLCTTAILAMSLLGCSLPFQSSQAASQPTHVGQSRRADGIRITLVEYWVVDDVGDPPLSKIHPSDRWVIALWRLRAMRQGEAVGYFLSNSSVCEGRTGRAIGPDAPPSTLDPHEVFVTKLAYEIAKGTRSLRLTYGAFGGTPEVTWRIRTG